MKFIYSTIVSLLLMLVLSGCSEKRLDYEEGANEFGHTAPTDFTIKANRKVLAELPDFGDQDFEQARRGLIASPSALIVQGQQGKTLFDQNAYAFIKGPAPSSVNPSLWRQEQLNNIHGLFKVSEGIYQLRGFDLANMTIIEGKTGWIIVVAPRSNPGPGGPEYQ